MINDNFLICYNCYPLLADHCLDFSKEYYRQNGVIRLHNTNDFFNPLDVKNGDIVFVKTDFIVDGTFMNYFYDKINQNFVLITANSSYQVGHIGDKSFERMLKENKLIKWYCTNPPDIQSDKIIPLPIGFEEMNRNGGDQIVLNYMKDNKVSFKDKKDNIFLPYHSLSTNVSRTDFYNHLEDLEFIVVQKNKLPLGEYLSAIDENKYSICLEGAGNDTHRYYECLLVNSVPIMKNIPSVKKAFEYYNLPGIFVDSWYDIGDSFFEDIKKKEYDFSNVEEFLKVKTFYKLIRSI